NRVFFTSGGSEAVESAWKLAKAYHHLRGEPARTKLIARHLAYHGSSMGALSATRLTPLRAPFEPLTPGGVHVPNTNSYRWHSDTPPLGGGGVPGTGGGRVSQWGGRSLWGAAGGSRR